MLYCAVSDQLTTIAMKIGSPTEALNRANLWIFIAKKIKKIITLSSRNGANNEF